MVAQIILSNRQAQITSDNGGNIKSQVKKLGADKYMKGAAPSALARRCEEEFKDLTKEFKAPKFLNYGIGYPWSKIDKVKDQKLKGHYEYILSAVQKGMANSHPDVDLKTCTLHEFLDFVLSVDHTILWDSKVIGFDITMNPYAPEVKVSKTHEAYRGTKIKLMREFGYQGYIIILWSIKDYKNADKEDLMKQLLKGLQEYRPKDFTHIIHIK